MSDTRTNEELREELERAIENPCCLGCGMNALDILTARLTAYEAEHEVFRSAMDNEEPLSKWKPAFQAAWDNAERVRRDE